MQPGVQSGPSRSLHVPRRGEWLRASPKEAAGQPRLGLHAILHAIQVRERVNATLCRLEADELPYDSMAKVPSVAGQSSPSPPPHVAVLGPRLLCTLWRSLGRSACPWRRRQPRRRPFPPRALRRRRRWASSSRASTRSARRPAGQMRRARLLGARRLRLASQRLASASRSVSPWLPAHRLLGTPNLGRPRAP